MKKRLLLPLLGIFLLASCTTQRTEVYKKVIVTEAEEVEVVQIKNDISDIYKEVYDSCVGIYVSDAEGAGAGSGVVYKYDDTTKSYYVVTNAHVVEGMTTVKVFDGESIYYPANVLGYDKTNDVAVITFTTDILGEERTFTPITLMDQEYEDLVTVGQTALVLGCPLSLENYNHLSVGTVSQVEEKRIYTDATVNPGNSGGGMFNMEGRLIGLINSKTVWTTQTEDGITSQLPVEGMGYAITLDVVKNCITEIEENGGEITRHVFGMYVTMVNSLLGDQNYLDYKQYLPEGEGQYAYVVIKSFLEGSVAEAQGLRVGDVILKFNGETVKVNNDISNLLTLVSPNEDVILTIYRSSEEKVMDVTITWGK